VSPRFERIDVDPSNREQLRNWDGDEGAYWAAHAGAYDRMMRPYHGALLDAAGITATDAVLDVGCGCGQVTRDAAARAAAGSALGVDLSSAMLDVARRLAAAEQRDNARFLQADAQVHAFETGSFDAVLSRNGALFFGDPVVAFANLARALRPGGRLALLGWQGVQHNEWFRALRAAMAAGRDLPDPRAGAPGPFALSDPAHIHDVLGRAGFTAVELTGRSAPLCVGGDVDEAFPFVHGFLAWTLADLDAAGRDRALDSLRASLEAHRTRDGVEYGSAAWLITARRAEGG
jgi:SAM-dependent methyltransferase